MFSMLTEDGAESHLWATREALSAIFRHGQHTAANVTNPAALFFSEFGLSGRALDYWYRFKTRNFYKERHGLYFAQVNWLNSTLSGM